jgi:methionyl-tRNA formyltransferase
MKIVVLGRTKWLIDTALLLQREGHKIVAVATARPEPSYQCGPEDFAALAETCGAQNLGIVSAADRELQSRISELNPDLAVSINWPNRIDKDTINLFAKGIMNAHCGDLPRYRGNACPNWAIINGENRIGLCVHMMQPEEVDTGPVLLRDFMPVESNTYITDVYKWLDTRIPSLMTQAVSGLSNGAIIPVPQPEDPSLALRCYPRRPEDGRINWLLSAENISRLIRASSRPFEGAFALWKDGKKCVIWRARLYENPTPFSAVPGQIILRCDGMPVVACGVGSLLLEECEIENIAPAATQTLLSRSLRNRLV